MTKLNQTLVLAEKRVWMAKAHQMLAKFSVIIVLVGCAGVAGCAGIADYVGSTVTQANYDKIENGMTLAEVEAILGKGEEQASSNFGGGGISMEGKAMVWQNRNEIISVVFLNGEVMSKAQMGLR